MKRCLVLPDEAQQKRVKTLKIIFSWIMKWIVKLFYGVTKEMLGFNKWEENKKFKRGESINVSYLSQHTNSHIYHPKFIKLLNYFTCYSLKIIIHSSQHLVLYSQQAAPTFRCFTLFPHSICVIVFVSNYFEWLLNFFTIGAPNIYKF